MTTLDPKADLISRLRKGHEAITPAPSARYYHVPPTALELEAADFLSALPAQPVAVKRFPILNSDGATIDWRLVADHGAQAQRNHYQSVQRLAERGGLAWQELHAVLHDQPYKSIDANEAITACRALEARYVAALAAPSQQEGVTDEMVRAFAKAVGMGTVTLNRQFEKVRQGIEAALADRDRVK